MNNEIRGKMSIAIKDIPDEIFDQLREDYQDELATMKSVEEDELAYMLVNSKINDTREWNSFYFHLMYSHDLQSLSSLYNFETKGWDNNLRCITFTRTVEHGDTHEVILEDHRDDEPTNDWLIFSSLKDNITDWDGQLEDAQYPLELGEYRLFARLIDSIEQLYPLEKPTSAISEEQNS